MVESSDEEVLVADVLDCVIIREVVCEGEDVLVLVTTIDKEVVVVDEKVPMAETVSENEFVGYTDVCGVVLIVLEGVGNDLVEVKAVMAVVMLVTLAWPTLEEFEYLTCNVGNKCSFTILLKRNKVTTSICLSYYPCRGCIYIDESECLVSKQ